MKKTGTKKALVTGANGFLGSFLVERLIREGFSVRCLVRKTSRLTYLSDLQVEFAVGDIRDPYSLKEAVKDVDFVFHTAALKRAFKESEYFQANQQGTANLLNACITFNPDLERFVYVSTLAVTAPAKEFRRLTEQDPCFPVGYYGKSKLAGEEEVRLRQEKLPCTIVRPPSVYGPRDEDVFQFFKTVNAGFKLLLGFRERYFALCYIDDLVEGIYLASQNKQTRGQTYFIADEKIYSYREFADEIARCLGKKAITIRFPKIAVLALGFFNDLRASIIRRPAVVSYEKGLEMIQDYWFCDTAKAKKEFGFSTRITLAEGVSRTVRWYKEHNWL